MVLYYRGYLLSFSTRDPGLCQARPQRPAFGIIFNFQWSVHKSTSHKESWAKQRKGQRAKSTRLNVDNKTRPSCVVTPPLLSPSVTPPGDQLPPLFQLVSYTEKKHKYPRPAAKKENQNFHFKDWPQERSRTRGHNTTTSGLCSGKQTVTRRKGERYLRNAKEGPKEGIRCSFPVKGDTTATRASIVPTHQ